MLLSVYMRPCVCGRARGSSRSRSLQINLRHREAFGWEGQVCAMDGSLQQCAIECHACNRFIAHTHIYNSRGGASKCTLARLSLARHLVARQEHGTPPEGRLHSDLIVSCEIEASSFDGDSGRPIEPAPRREARPCCLDERTERLVPRIPHQLTIRMLAHTVSDETGDARYIPAVA